MNNNGQSPIGEDRYGTPIYLGDEVIVVDNGVPCISIISRRSTGDKTNYIATPRDKELRAKNNKSSQNSNSTIKFDDFNKIVSPDRMKYRCIKVSD